MTTAEAWSYPYHPPYHLTHYLKLELIFEDFHMITINFLPETAEAWTYP
jgi:hypothetical protein